MDTTIRKRLEKEIGRWERLLEGECINDWNCSLFSGSAELKKKLPMCPDDCPVFVDTGKQQCKGTPFEDYDGAHENELEERGISDARDPKAAEDGAKRHLAYLEGFLEE